MVSIPSEAFAWTDANNKFLALWYIILWNVYKIQEKKKTDNWVYKSVARFKFTAAFYIKKHKVVIYPVFILLLKIPLVYTELFAIKTYNLGYMIYLLKVSVFQKC